MATTQPTDDPRPDQGPGSAPPTSAIVDPWEANPMTEEMQSRDPAHYNALADIVAPPKMFAGGTADVPAFTASGIEPELLLRLPFRVRHAAAAEPDITAVHALFEEHGNNPNMVIEHPGLADAWQRTEQWFAQEADARTPEQRQADDDALYRQFYNPDNDAASYDEEQVRRQRAGEPPLPPRVAQYPPLT